MTTKEVIGKFLELDKKDKKMYMLQVTVISTFIVGLVKLILGIIYSSIWFYMNATFYGILTFSEYRSVRDYRKIKKVKDKSIRRKIAYKNYLYNGWLLVLLGIAYFYINVTIYQTGTTHNYLGGFLVYLVALVSFSSMATAINGIKKYRRKKDPIVAAACQGNIAKALTSLVLTQVVLIDEFSSTAPERIIKLDGITGMLVGFIIIILGLRMVVKITREDRKKLLKSDVRKEGE